MNKLNLNKDILTMIIFNPKKIYFLLIVLFINICACTSEDSKVMETKEKAVAAVPRPVPNSLSLTSSEADGEFKDIKKAVIEMYSTRDIDKLLPQVYTEGLTERDISFFKNYLRPFISGKISEIVWTDVPASARNLELEKLGIKMTLNPEKRLTVRLLTNEDKPFGSNLILLLGKIDNKLMITISNTK